MAAGWYVPDMAMGYNQPAAGQSVGYNYNQSPKQQAAASGISATIDTAGTVTFAVDDGHGMVDCRGVANAGVLDVTCGKQKCHVTLEAL